MFRQVIFIIGQVVSRFLFKKENLWEGKKTTVVVGEAGVGWFSDPGNTAARSCDSTDVGNWFYLNPLNTDANRVFVEVEYRVTDTYCDESGCGLFLREHHGAINTSEDIEMGDFSSKTIRITDTERRNETIHYDIKSKSPYLTFAIEAKGVCVWLYNISIYYYYCPRNISKSVILERTPAPSVGSQSVRGYCSESLGNTNRSIVTECNSDGTWKNFDPQPNLCHCSAGYEFNNDSGHCTPCKKNHFKKHTGEDEPCQLCPENTVSELETGSTSCRCVTNYHRNSDDEECRYFSNQVSKDDLAGWKIGVIVVGVLFGIVFLFVAVRSRCVRSNRITHQPTKESQDAHSSQRSTNVDEREHSSVAEGPDRISPNFGDDSQSEDPDRALDERSLRNEESFESGVSHLSERRF